MSKEFSSVYQTLGGEQITPPASWGRRERKTARLDLIVDDVQYWVMDGEVYKHQDGATRWFSTLAGWEGSGRKLVINTARAEGKKVFSN